MAVEANDRANASPTPIASFFFSLKDNTEIQAKRLEENVDFNTMLLLDTKYKIVFIMFYSAIIYHLAKIMKAKNEEMPRHIAFSGNGSKVIRILTSSDSTLEKFTKKIFEKVYEQKYPSDGLTILQNVDNPKEVTCKGGLSNPTKQDYEDITSTKIVYNSVNDGPNEFIESETYGDITDTHLNKTVDENYRKEILDSCEISIKYKGYIQREQQMADKIMRLENLTIPENFDFDKVESLSIECRQKLKKYAPRTIAQASRISGISPADVSVLLVYFGR